MSFEFTSATIVGDREDLSDLIHNIAPTETPVLTACGTTTATSTVHEWQRDSLLAPRNNAAPEGHETSDGTWVWDGQATVRLNNQTQISEKQVRVTGTTEVRDKAGRDSEMAYQSALRARELKTDVDYTICATNLDKDATITGRQSASLMVWLGNTAVIPTGSGAVAPVTNDGDNTWSTLTTTPQAFIQGDLDLAIENCWNLGGKPTLIVAGPKRKTDISKFDGVGNGAGANNTTRTDRAERTIYATADVYVSNFGTLNVVPSRHVRPTAATAADDGYPATVSEDDKVFVIDPEYLKVAYLRPWQQFDLAKVGDSVRRMMLVEWSLEVCNQDAHSVIVGLT